MLLLLNFFSFDCSLAIFLWSFIQNHCQLKYSHGLDARKIENHSLSMNEVSVFNCCSISNRLVALLLEVPVLLGQADTIWIDSVGNSNCIGRTFSLSNHCNSGGIVLLNLSNKFSLQSFLFLIVAGRFQFCMLQETLAGK